jgi:ubiquinone biosynthesis protein Coq4
MSIPQTYTVTRVPLRERIALTIVAAMKPVYFLLRHNRTCWRTTQADLAIMPEGTLGKDLSNFLHINGLQLMPRAEFHDVYHVLFGFGTTMKEETCIQFVPLGNGRRSIPYLVTITISIIFYPENWEDFYKAYRIGKSANKFHDWDFEPMLGIRTDEVRRRIFEYHRQGGPINKTHTHYR